MKRNCRHCNEEFESFLRKKFCSDICNKEYRKIYLKLRYEKIVICKICISEFKGNSKVKYCSDECRKKSEKLKKQKYAKSGKNKLRLIEYKKTQKSKDSTKKYYDKKNNSPERKLYMKEWNKNNKSKRRQYSRKRMEREDVKLKSKEYGKEYSKRPEVVLRRKKKQNSQEHKERTKVYNEKYFKSEKGKLWAFNMNHRRRERMGRGKGVTLKEYREIWEKYNYKCSCCYTDQKITNDHIIPLAKGGFHEKDNIQLLCNRCNWIKGAKIISLEELRGLIQQRCLNYGSDI